jgi:hypothetical protein
MTFIAYTKYIAKHYTITHDTKMADNQNLTAGKTAVSVAYARGYDDGYSVGYRCGVEDGWSRGYDEGLEEAERLR